MLHKVKLYAIDGGLNLLETVNSGHMSRWPGSGRLVISNTSADVRRCTQLLTRKLNGIGLKGGRIFCETCQYISKKSPQMLQ